MIAALLLAAGAIAGGCSPGDEDSGSGPTGSGASVEPVIQLEHTLEVQRFQFSPDGKWLLTAGRDGQVIQWDAVTGDLVRSFAASGFEIAPDGQSLLMILSEASVSARANDPGQTAAVPSLVSLQTGRVLQQVREVPEEVRPMTVSPDGRWAIGWQRPVGYAGSELLLWDVCTARVVHRFEEHLAERAVLFWDHEPAWPVTSSGDRLQGWRDGPVYSNEIRIAFPREVREVLPSIEGLPAEAKHWLEGFILPTSGRWPLLLAHHASGVMSPCGTRVAKRTHASPGVRTLTIYDLEQDAEPRELRPSDYTIDSAAFSPDGTQLVIGGMSASWRAGVDGLLMASRPSGRLQGE